MSGETVFSGFVRAPDPAVADFGAFLDSATVQCQGHNDALRYRRIHGTEGVEIVEAADGEAQFSQIVALLAGYTGSTDLDSTSVAIRTDIRYQTVAAVLRALAVANDAILHVTTARQVRLFQRANLTASALGRLGSADLFRYNLLRDPRKVRSRQILRYGEAVAQRTITGDGSARAFLVAGTQAAVDYMAAGVAARPLNAQAGDQGLRMRADATAAARTGGGIDFFGGNAGAPGSGLYVGATLVGAADVSLRMLTNGKMQLSAGTPLDAAARYGIALRHEGTGSPVWTSDGITPEIKSEAAGMTRESASDFEHGGRPWYFEAHGDIVFMMRSDHIYGYRVSSGATVRDSRFDVTTPSSTPSHAVVIGATLHLLYVSGGKVRSYAYGINAGSLTRLSGSDIDVDQPDSGTLLRAYVNDDQSKLWVRTSTTSRGVIFGNWRGFSIDNQGALARSAADDFNVASPFSGSQEIHGFWRVGDYIYYNRTPSGSGNTVVRRWRISTRTSDAATVDLGGRFAFERAMFGFGSHVFAASALTNDSGVPGGARAGMRAVRVAGDFLEWDAPAADYSTLNARRQANAGFRVAVMDSDIIGVSVPGAEFVPTLVDVRSVRRITLNGTQEDLGDGETWRFDVARQKLIQDPGATALTTTDALVVDYAARAIAQACNPTAAVMRDNFTDLRDSEGLAFDDALETAEAFLDRYGDADGSPLNRDPGPHRTGRRGRDGAVRYHDAPGARAHRRGGRRPVVDLRRAIPVGWGHPDPAGGVPARGVPRAVRGLVARAGRRRVEATQPPCYDWLHDSARGDRLGSRAALPGRALAAGSGCGGAPRGKRPRPARDRAAGIPTAPRGQGEKRQCLTTSTR